MNYHMELSVVAREKLTPTEFEETFDAIAEALYDCEGVEDADLAGDYDEATFTFTMNVLNLEDPEQAFGKGMAVARTALHVSGGSTPKWEEQFSFIRQTIEAQSFVSA